MTATTISVRTHSAPRLGSRAVWLVLATALVAFAIVEVRKHHLGPWPIVAFLVFPDLTMLVGAGVKTEHGQLATRAVPLYNFVHRPIVPLAVIAAASFDLFPMFWFVSGLAWLAHIAIDHVAGYGLRTADGWQR